MTISNVIAAGAPSSALARTDGNAVSPAGRDEAGRKVFWRKAVDVGRRIGEWIGNVLGKFFGFLGACAVSVGSLGIVPAVWNGQARKDMFSSFLDGGAQACKAVAGGIGVGFGALIGVLGTPIAVVVDRCRGADKTPVP